MRLLSWNLYHGRSTPPAGRSLLNQFCAALDGWAWDVALLQEVPPWWPPLLAQACGAEHAAALTSRNGLLPVRRAISARNPDILKANGGGANAILVRGGAGGGAVTARARIRLTVWPERRIAHGVRLSDGTWVVNLHVTTDPKHRTRADLAKARAATLRWAAGAPVVLGGDFNLVRPEIPDFDRVASHHVDHVFVRGLRPDGQHRLLDAGTLSDHRPVSVSVSADAVARG